jgi:hypothetical protein
MNKNIVQWWIGRPDDTDLGLAVAIVLATGMKWTLVSVNLDGKKCKSINTAGIKI